MSWRAVRLGFKPSALPHPRGGRISTDRPDHNWTTTSVGLDSRKSARLGRANFKGSSDFAVRLFHHPVCLRKTNQSADKAGRAGVQSSLAPLSAINAVRFRNATEAGFAKSLDQTGYLRRRKHPAASRRFPELSRTDGPCRGRSTCGPRIP